MAGLGVVGTIAIDASDDFVRANLVEQAWQHRRIAGGVVRDFNGPDFQDRSIPPASNLIVIKGYRDGVNASRPVA